ncbi:MAG: hypothetical protein HYZ27_02360 [Deltaproteobacteria bacterium]|nr:hypothetical protein [Deltaproteobacteria bacterium]
MSLRKLGVMLSASCLTLWACEEAATEALAEEVKPAEGGAAAGGAAAASPGPKEVCTALVEAAKNKDEAAFTGMLTDAAALGDNKEAVFTAIGGSTCGEPTMSEDGNKATVPATAGDTTRDIALVKGEGGWKLDTAAYMEKYGKGKDKKAKKEKAKKGKKAKKNK